MIWKKYMIRICKAANWKNQVSRWFPEIPSLRPDHRPSYSWWCIRASPVFFRDLKSEESVWCLQLVGGMVWCQAIHDVMAFSDAIYKAGMEICFPYYLRTIQYNWYIWYKSHLWYTSFELKILNRQTVVIGRRDDQNGNIRAWFIFGEVQHDFQAGFLI